MFGDFFGGWVGGYFDVVQQFEDICSTNFALAINNPKGASGVEISSTPTWYPP